jgi:lysylphosphatidylglycerol synthetase-like protein (DUF2156 family)
MGYSQKELAHLAGGRHRLCERSVGHIADALARIQGDSRLFTYVLPFGLHYWGRSLTLVFGFLLIYLSLNIFERKRVAWWLALIASVLLVVAHILSGRLEKVTSAFLSLCFNNGWTVCFLLPDLLPMYQRLGLRILKIGEEAVVDLQRFSSMTGQNRYFRYHQPHFEREGYKFARYKPPHPMALLDEVEGSRKNGWLFRNIVSSGFSRVASIVAIWRRRLFALCGTHRGRS